MNGRPMLLLSAIAMTIAVGPIVDAAPAAGASAAPPITLTPVAEVASPVDLAWRPGDTALYVVGRDGEIVRADGDATTLVLDVNDLTEGRGERGLLGLAFSLDGTNAYINFTDNNGDTNVVELTVNSDGTLDRDSMRIVLLVEQPYPNHNGGDLAFGPDGMLYIGLGDGGGAGDPQRRAQNIGELLGKMLRIDPATPSGDLGYTIPADNPFVGVEGARGEIWSLGLRNPWRYSFDPETGDLWITDVGASTLEEINVAPAVDAANAGRGFNFGWSGYEGSERFNEDVTVENHRGPIFQYNHGGGRCSISGGVRARGEGAGALAGWYVFADYCTGEVMAISVSGASTGIAVSPESTVLIDAGDRVTAVASGPDGAVYVLTFGDTVYRIDAA
jgi:glucose/arabinose dehydrogenase